MPQVVVVVLGELGADFCHVGHGDLTIEVEVYRYARPVKQ